MYTIAYYDYLYTTNKYVHVYERRLNETPKDFFRGIFNTEEDFAYYLFAHKLYQSNYTPYKFYDQYYSSDGHKLNQEEINLLIEKHLPQEVQAISQRKQLEKHSIFKYFIQWGLMSSSKELHHDLIHRTDMNYELSMIHLSSQGLVKSLINTIDKERQDKKDEISRQAELLLPEHIKKELRERAEESRDRYLSVMQPLEDAVNALPKGGVRVKA